MSSQHDPRHAPQGELFDGMEVFVAKTRLAPATPIQSFTVVFEFRNEPDAGNGVFFPTFGEAKRRGQHKFSVWTMPSGFHVEPSEKLANYFYDEQGDMVSVGMQPLPHLMNGHVFHEEEDATTLAVINQKGVFVFAYTVQALLKGGFVVRITDEDDAFVGYL